MALSWWLALMCCACGRVGCAPSDSASADGPPPAIAVAQATGGSSNAAAIQVTFSAPVQDHNAIILCFTYGHGGASLVSMADTLGNNYSLVLGPVVTNNLDHFVAFAPSSPGGTDTVTVTLSAAPGGWEMLVLEYTGLTAFDTATYNSAPSGNMMSSGNVMTRSAHELLLAYGHSTTPMAGPGYTERAIRSSSLVEDSVVFAVGSYSATATTSPGIWTLILAAFEGS